MSQFSRFDSFNSTFTSDMRSNIYSMYHVRSGLSCGGVNNRLVQSPKKNRKVRFAHTIFISLSGPLTARHITRNLVLRDVIVMHCSGASDRDLSVRVPRAWWWSGEVRNEFV
jgi:hypothetical protein